MINSRNIGHQHTCIRHQSWTAFTTETHSKQFEVRVREPQTGVLVINTIWGKTEYLNNFSCNLCWFFFLSHMNRSVNFSTAQDQEFYSIDWLSNQFSMSLCVQLHSILMMFIFLVRIFYWADLFITYFKILSIKLGLKKHVWKTMPK